MSVSASYKGDVALAVDRDGDLDIDIRNGQPDMTEFIENSVNLYIFGEDSWYNDIVDLNREKMKSGFPEFIKTAAVSDTSVAKGIVLISEALKPLTDNNIAAAVNVSGEIISVYGIRWTASIEKPIGNILKYSILWEKGEAILKAL